MAVSSIRLHNRLHNRPIMNPKGCAGKKTLKVDFELSTSQEKNPSFFEGFFFLRSGKWGHPPIFHFAGKKTLTLKTPHFSLRVFFPVSILRVLFPAHPLYDINRVCQREKGPLYPPPVEIICTKRRDLPFWTLLFAQMIF